MSWSLRIRLRSWCLRATPISQSAGFARFKRLSICHRLVFPCRCPKSTTISNGCADTSSGELFQQSAMKARVFVTLKSGVLDPQGKAIEGALRSLGVAGVTSVRQAKAFEIDIQGADRA